MKTFVQVLLSSYNGEKYIEEQLDSILRQEQVQVQILIRDDGSRDKTREILSAYCEKYDNISVVFGENVGVIKSFFELIRLADKKYPFFAFSDQDDVWLPNKLSRAVGLLSATEENSLCKRAVYCSRTQLVDAELHPMKSAIHYKNVKTQFGNALVENMCTGCTCVVTQSLLQLLKENQPKFTIMHDFWIYLVGTCFGTVIYDNESRILYRQHGGNELGSASGLIDNFIRRLRYYRVHRYQLSKQAEELLNIYKFEMTDENRQLAQDIVQSKSDVSVRKKLLSSKKVFRQRKSDNIIFRVLLILGQI